MKSPPVVIFQPGWDHLHLGLPTASGTRLPQLPIFLSLLSVKAQRLPTGSRARVTTGQMKGRQAPVGCLSGTRRELRLHPRPDLPPQRLLTLTPSQSRTQKPNMYLEGMGGGAWRLSWEGEGERTPSRGRGGMVSGQGYRLPPLLTPPRPPLGLLPTSAPAELSWQSPGLDLPERNQNDSNFHLLESTAF